MPVVPITRNMPQAQGQPMAPPPEPWMMMAAAQMHAEGKFDPPDPKKDLFETRPLASFGGRSIVETNNPELGPTDIELRERQKEMEMQRRRNGM